MVVLNYLFSTKEIQAFARSKELLTSLEAGGKVIVTIVPLKPLMTLI